MSSGHTKWKQHCPNKNNLNLCIQPSLSRMKWIQYCTYVLHTGVYSLAWCSIREKHGFYAEIQIVFGTVCFWDSVYLPGRYWWPGHEACSISSGLLSASAHAECGGQRSRTGPSYGSWRPLGYRCWSSRRSARWPPCFVGGPWWPRPRSRTETFPPAFRTNSSYVN